MNLSIIRVIIGYLLKTEAALLLLPSVTSLIYQEQEGVYYFGVAVLCAVLGILLNLKKPQSTVFYLKEGCVATALSWVTLSFFGALPFWISGEIPSLTDALFETISGFTTTGASILPDVEALSHTALFWRSFTHWIGGMGVLVFILAIIPLTGGSDMNLMKAESPGPSVGKLVPKIKQTARILYCIYIGLTIIEIIFLLFGGLSLFESMCMSFGTAGTGGFGIKGDSAGSYTSFVQWVLIIFMILFGINFNFYYFVIYKQLKKALHIDEIKHYLCIILIAVILITYDITHIYHGIGTAIKHSAFQVASIITTTGFSSVDFNAWPSMSKGILVLLMFIGACAGSTGGGIKVSRIMILVKSMFRELSSYIHPKSVKKLKMDNKALDKDVISSVHTYFATFMLIFVASVFIISTEGYDFETNFTAIAATINNIGPGLALVGPAANFAFWNNISKFVMMFDMLAGRLELFPMLILFHPAIWKDSIGHQSRKIKTALKENKN